MEQWQGYLEDVVNMSFSGKFEGKRVLVTGHTGFKGAWLCEWLLRLGAQVTGFSLPAGTDPSLFKDLNLSARLEHVIGDIRDLAALKRVVAQVAPEFVFHLAAQPLVRLSYQLPLETYETNVMGTVHLLEAIRAQSSRCIVVAVTSDKCYENKESLHGYREDDPLGGHDPYSSSKGAMEIIVSAYRRSYFAAQNSEIRLSAARAGNVIGGGDWAPDRIVPDCIRNLQAGAPIIVRSKSSTRPWQHVLEPISGYLWLAACLQSPTLLPEAKKIEDFYSKMSTFNFGPGISANRKVSELVTEVLKHWPGNWTDQPSTAPLHEAKLLGLSNEKAYHLLGWSPTWTFEETVARTVNWYKSRNSPNGAQTQTAEQIDAYTEAARQGGSSWAIT